MDSGFYCTNNKGVQFVFPNGLLISLQWGSSNYCSNRDKSGGTPECSDCEIAIWDTSDGKIYDECIFALVKPEEAARFIYATSKAETLEDLKIMLNKTS